MTWPPDAARTSVRALVVPANGPGSDHTLRMFFSGPLPGEGPIMHAIKALLAQIDDQSAVLGTLAVVATTLASLGVLLIG